MPTFNSLKNIKSGFTLLEVLIATLIMVSVLGSLVYGLSQCSNLTETTRNQGIALNGAQQKLEEITNNTGQITAYHDQNFPIQDAQGNALLTAPPGQGNPGSVRVIPIGTTNLYNVTITIKWIQRGGRQLAYTITTTFCQ